MIEVRAHLKHLRMSPKKVRVVADAIKGLPAEQALARLQFIPKAPAPVLAKLLRSALANARNNNNLTDDLLMVKSIVVEEGVALKRWKPAAFGSAHEYKKRASHVKLVLSLKAGAKLPKGVSEKSELTKKEAAKPVQAEAVSEAKSEKKTKPVRTKPAPKKKASDTK